MATSEARHRRPRRRRTLRRCSRIAPLTNPRSISAACSFVTAARRARSSVSRASGRPHSPSTVRTSVSPRRSRPASSADPSTSHDREAHRRDEQPFLRPVEVMDERRVDPGVRRDAPDRGALVSVICEPGARGLEDRLPRGARRTCGPCDGAWRRRAGSCRRASPLADRELQEPLLERRAGFAHLGRHVGERTANRPGSTPGTRSVRPTSAAVIPWASSASNARSHSPVRTTATRVSPTMSATVPSATTRPSAMTTSRSPPRPPPCGAS